LQVWRYTPDKLSVAIANNARSLSDVAEQEIDNAAIVANANIGSRIAGTVHFSQLHPLRNDALLAGVIAF
jgi:hypothetical protein